MFQAMLDESMLVGRLVVCRDGFQYALDSQSRKAFCPLAHFANSHKCIDLRMHHREAAAWMWEMTTMLGYWCSEIHSTLHSVHRIGLPSFAWNFEDFAGDTCLCIRPTDDYLRMVNAVHLR